MQGTWAQWEFECPLSSAVDDAIRADVGTEALYGRIIRRLGCRAASLATIEPCGWEGVLEEGGAKTKGY